MRKDTFTSLCHKIFVPSLLGNKPWACARTELKAKILFANKPMGLFPSKDGTVNDLKFTYRLKYFDQAHSP